MSDPNDAIPEATEDQLTRPTPGVPQDIGRAIEAARTLELHGSPSLAQAAAGIARSKIGEREPNRQERPNEGPIVDWSLEGLTSRDAGPWAQWCAYFACQCVRRALIAAGADAMTLRDFRRNWASGSCTSLWTKYDNAGLATRHVPGQPLPEGAYFLFFGEERDGKPHLRHVEVIDRHNNLSVTHVGGNTSRHADRVVEHQTLLVDEDIYGTARLPYDQVSG